MLIKENTPNANILGENAWEYMGFAWKKGIAFFKNTYLHIIEKYRNGICRR